MQTFMRNTLKLTAILALVFGMFGAGVPQAQAATLPATSACTSAAGVATCNLWAKSLAASYTPPGGSPTTIWGYTDTAAGTLTAPGGPVLIVNQNDVVTVNLTNTLAESTSLLFQGQDMIPDTSTGAAPTTGTKSYSFTAKYPGTFLYEAGLRPGRQHQVAMGLYGALVVRPSGAPLQAYANATTAFDEEALVMLSELDPVLNNSAAPATFDMRKYAPQYFLINGKAYPSTDAIAVTPGTKVLLRYVNAGLQAHAMGVLGFSQKIVGQDGSAYAYGHSMVAETIATGQTLDAIVAIPASAGAGTKYALYDANMQLHNSNTTGIGGMLTFLAVAGTAGGSGGPATTAVALSPNPSNDSSAVTLSANIAAGGTAAEYFVDTVGVNGAGCAMSGTTSVSAIIPVSGGIAPCADLTTLTSGNHTFYVHGTNGSWGPFASAVLSLDKVGPVTSALSLVPNPTNGTVSVSLAASASDSTGGNHNIIAAEYRIDGVGPVPLTVNVAAPTAGLSATIAQATVIALSQGNHTITVRSQDALNNWGGLASVTLKVDKTGPVTSLLSASPSSNNGSTPFNTSVPAVRVFATFNDTTGSSNIAAGEGFIDVVGTTGTGFAFVASNVLPNDGLFNSPTETGYADIPLPVIASLAAGSHTIYIHARDAAGNWGATSTLTYNIDKLPPTVSGAALTPPASNNTAVVISATADDTASGNSNIGGGEYFIDTLGAVGTGAPMTPAATLPNTTISATIPAAAVAALSAGNHTIYVRARDAAGNWSTTTTATLIIDRTPPTFTNATINPTSISQGTLSVTMAVNGPADTGGSGLANAGEYWFDTASITPGTGSAFTGTSGISVATGSLTVGTHTLRVRIKDNAGNWSTVHTASLAVTGDTTAPTFSSITLAPNLFIVGTVSTVNLTVNGAVDTGGSGLFGGEYWIGAVNVSNPPNPAQGSGTQFSNLALTNINVSALTTVGTYTVEVRLRDGAGNWSSGGSGIRSATITVVPDAIFSNTFASASSPYGWTSVNNTVSVTAGANLNGAATNGMQAAGNGTNYVQFDFGTTANPATGTFDARFYFNPNSNNSAGKDILTGRTTGGTTLFHVRYRLSAGATQVQIQEGGTANASWVTISNATHRIEVVWRAGSGGTGLLALYVDESPVQSLAHSNTGSVGSVRMGSVTNTGASTLMSFDAFSAKRSISALIGP